MRDGGVLPDPGKVFILEFSSAMVFDSSLKFGVRYVNCGDVGDKSKKNRRQGSGFDLICFDQIISGLTSLRYRRLRLRQLRAQQPQLQRLQLQPPRARHR